MAIKKIDMKAEFKYISIEDSAIDQELSDLKKYEETCDISHLQLKEGEEPTYFILKNIPRRQFAMLITSNVSIDAKGEMVAKSEVAGLDMLFDVFKAGCVEIEEKGKREKIDPELLELTVVKEVSEAISKLATLQPHEKK